MVLDDVIVTMATVVDKTIPLMTGVDQLLHNINHITVTFIRQFAMNVKLI